MGGQIPVAECSGTDQGLLVFPSTPCPMLFLQRAWNWFWVCLNLSDQGVITLNPFLCLGFSILIADSLGHLRLGPFFKLLVYLSGSLAPRLLSGHSFRVYSQLGLKWPWATLMKDDGCSAESSLPTHLFLWKAPYCFSYKWAICAKSIWSWNNLGEELCVCGRGGWDAGG